MPVMLSCYVQLSSGA